MQVIQAGYMSQVARVLALTALDICSLPARFMLSNRLSGPMTPTSSEEELNDR